MDRESRFSVWQTVVLPPPSLAPAMDRNLFFFLAIWRDQGCFTNWSFGTGCAPTLGQRGAGGNHHWLWVPEHWLKAAPTRGNVRAGHILFGISFYL